MSQIVTNVTNAAFSYFKRLETERFNSAIDHLTKFTKEKPDRILDDKKCYSSLLLIGKTIYSHSEIIDYPVLVQSRFDNVISNSPIVWFSFNTVSSGLVKLIINILIGV